MIHAKFIASAGAILLATSALTSAASAQVVFKSPASSSSDSQVSSSYGGSSYYQAANVAPSYPSYVLAPQQVAPVPAPLPYPAPYAVQPDINYAAPAYAAPVASQATYVAPAYAAPAIAQPSYVSPTVQTDGYGATVMSYSMESAPSQQIPAPSDQMYVDHTHEYMDHDHAFVEHSHGYEQHQHSHEHPEAKFASMDDMADLPEVLPEEILIDEIVIDAVVVANDPIEEPYIEINPDIPDFEFSEESIIIDDTPYYGGPTRNNVVRLSAGYGYATTGNFNYGIEGNYTSGSADSADWTSTSGASTNNGTPWIDEELRHEGIYGSLKADAGNFFIDAVGGSYQVEDYAISQTYNLAEAAADSSILIGPAALVVDGSLAALSGLFGYGSGDGIEIDAYDSMEVIANINSSINDFGGAAGYLINFAGLPMSVGVGVAGKSLNRTTTVDVTSVLTEETTGELDTAIFTDHTYNEEVSDTYVGPALRVNFDPNVTGALSAHFGGSVQALYGTSMMTTTQEYLGTTYIAEASDTGTLITGEIDAGLSFALSPNMRIGAGVFAGITSGAPVVTSSVDSSALDAADRMPTLGRGSWQNYGLKGSISASF